jgi:hypothetical protein
MHWGILGPKGRAKGLLIQGSLDRSGEDGHGGVWGGGGGERMNILQQAAAVLRQCLTGSIDSIAPTHLHTSGV